MDSVFVALGALVVLGLIGSAYVRLSLRNEATGDRSDKPQK